MTFRLQHWLLACGLATAGLACSKNLDDEPGEAPPTPMPQAGVIDNGDGTWSLVVDATADAQHVDLADGGLVGADDGWDLWFQRFHIGVNGGAGGGGQGAAQWAADATLAVETAPAEGWLQDAPDGDDEDDLVDRVFADWYDYDEATHVLTPKVGVYFVRSSDGQAYYAVRIDDYYDDAGTSAMVRITWRTVMGEMLEPEPDVMEPDVMEPDVMEPDPLPEDAVAVDASSRDSWAYVRFGDSVETVGENDGWDIAIQRTFIQTNSGTSGDGLAGAKWADVPYDDIDSAPTIGYAADAMVPLPGPPGSGEASGSPIFNDAENGWYNYNPATHQVSAKEQAYFVRTHDGNYARFAIADYGSGVFQLREVVRLGRLPVSSGRLIGDEAIITEALELVGLADRADDLFDTLSGGQQQRVQLARALAQLWPTPDTPRGFLLLDEPTAHQDPHGVACVLRAARHWAAEGHGVICVLHDLNLAAAAFDTLVLLRTGRCVHTGPPNQVLQPEILAETYGIPMTVLTPSTVSHPIVLHAPGGFDDRSE